MSALGRAFVRTLRRLAPKRPAPFEPPARPHDPSPSRLRYRLDRLGRRAYVRFALRRLAAPALALALLAAAGMSEAVQTRVTQTADALRVALIDRPEFAVTRLDVVGGSERLRAQVARRIDFQGPVSSLRLDLRTLRETVEMTPGVSEATVAVLGEGVLHVRIAQRAPAALWRWDGQLHLVDAEGVVISPVARRADRPDLPLMVGEGADRAAPEALALWTQAAPLHPRLRAIVRVGERRWTLALLSGQEVWLPAEGAEAALSRLIELEATEDLLDREIAVIDLRDAERTVLRLTPRGVEVRDGPVEEDA